MKEQYLKELRGLLNLYNMDRTEKDDIISDYEEMYDNWTDYGMSDEEVETKLGEPSSIIGELVEGYRKIKTPGSSKELSGSRTKIIALSPFIALILFFIGGFGFNGWAYSWVAFLLIPVIAIISSMAGKEEHLLTALSPFIAVVGYGILGFFYGFWHPGWLIFLIIPVIAIVTERKTMKLFEFLTALSPFVAVSVFFIFFATNDLWVPGWLIFLIIPALGILNEKRFAKVLLWESLLLGGALGYLYIGEVYSSYDWALLAFAPLALYSFFSSDSNIFDMPWRYRFVVIGAALGYVALGLLSDTIGYNMWGYAWLLFLIIPVYAILTEVKGNEKIIALMPFISVFLFYTLGYFFGWWAYSWLAFLLIPMVAIIKEA